MMMETVPSGTILHSYYRIERVLGSGGFGHVYLVVDLRSNQQYALKEYLVTGTGGEEQLRHEAQMLNQLHHPNLPVFHDAFGERGHYYVVLSYIEGNDLTDLLRVARMRNEAIPLPRLLGWMIAICDAVTFLHSQRPPVIHRDIKPDNIRITSDGTAILVDLGNAKAAADGMRTLLFIRHQGTPGYAPPEQYPGGTGTDIRSDVYALGGTLYFALTTHEPPSVSVRNTSLQQGQQDLPSLQQRLASNPPVDAADPQRHFRLGTSKPQKPAPRHSRHLAQLGELPPPVLEQLNRIIARAMALRPDKRYQSVADMSNDLRKVQAALPAPQTQAVPPVREIDPHSTQPDLQQLYEVVQAAKEQEARDPASAPSPQAKSAMTCPRCGAIITDQAAYCRVCGTPLQPQSGNTPGHHASSISKQSANSSVQKSAPSFDNRALAEEETVEMLPHRQPQAREQNRTGTSAPPPVFPPTSQTHTPQYQQDFVHPSAAVAPPQASPASKLVLPQQTVPASNTHHTDHGQQSPPYKKTPGTPISKTRSGLPVWLFLLVGIILLVLIALLLVLLAHHGPHAIRGLSAIFLASTGAFYERNAAISTAATSVITTTAPALSWLWACCAGIAATAGLAW